MPDLRTRLRDFLRALNPFAPEDEPEEHWLPPAPRTPAPPALPRPIAGYGHIWADDCRDANTLRTRLDTVATLGGKAVNLNGAGSAYTGRNTGPIRTACDALRTRGWTALLAINGPNDDEMALSPEDVRKGGEAWGPVLASYPDVLKGISTHNEINQQARDAATKGNDAEAVLEHAARISIAFAEGVRSTYRAARITPTAIGGQFLTRTGGDPYAVSYLRKIAPHVASGLFANVIVVHVYPMVLANKLATVLPALAQAAGFPSGTRFQITETNISLRDYGTPEAAGEGARKHLAAIYEAAKTIPIEYVIGFTPWNDSDYHRLIVPGSPVGDAFRDAAIRP